MKYTKKYNPQKMKKSKKTRKKQKNTRKKNNKKNKRYGKRRLGGNVSDIWKEFCRRVNENGEDAMTVFNDLELHTLVDSNLSRANSVVTVGSELALDNSGDMITTRATPVNEFDDRSRFSPAIFSPAFPLTDNFEGEGTSYFIPLSGSSSNLQRSQTPPPNPNILDPNYNPTPLTSANQYTFQDLDTRRTLSDDTDRFSSPSSSSVRASPQQLERFRRDRRSPNINSSSSNDDGELTFPSLSSLNLQSSSIDSEQDSGSGSSLFNSVDSQSPGRTPRQGGRKKTRRNNKSKKTRKPKSRKSRRYVQKGGNKEDAPCYPGSMNFPEILCDGMEEKMPPNIHSAKIIHPSQTQEIGSLSSLENRDLLPFEPESGGNVKDSSYT